MRARSPEMSQIYVFVTACMKAKGEIASVVKRL
jgi:hypothetical protein